MQKGKDIYLVYCAQGGAFGLIPAAFGAKIEELSGLPLSQTATMIAGASVGAIQAGAMTLENPERPGMPLYTAEEYQGLLRAELPLFMPYDPSYYDRQVVGEVVKGLKDHARRVFTAGFGFRIDLGWNHLSASCAWAARWLLPARAASSSREPEKPDIHYSLDYPESRLRNLFHGAAVGDALTGLAVNAHRMGPEHLSGPYDFIRVPEGFNREKFFSALLPFSSPQEQAAESEIRAEIPAHQAVLASIVCPTLFPAYEIPGIGFFTDIGGVNNPLGLVEALKASAPPGHSIRFIYLGTGITKAPDIGAYNRANFLSTIGPLLDMNNAHVRCQFLDAIARSLGVENVTTLDIGLEGIRDIRNTTPEHLSAIEALAQEGIEKQKETIGRLAEDMGNGHIRRAARAPDSAFLPTQTPLFTLEHRQDFALAAAPA